MEMSSGPRKPVPPSSSANQRSLASLSRKPQIFTQSHPQSTITKENKLQKVYRNHSLSECCLVTTLTMKAGMRLYDVLEVLTELIRLYSEQKPMLAGDVRQVAKAFFANPSLPACVYWKLRELLHALRRASKAAILEKTLSNRFLQANGYSSDYWNSLQFISLALFNEDWQFHEWQFQSWSEFTCASAADPKSEKTCRAILQFLSFDARHWFPGLATDLRRNRLLAIARFLQAHCTPSLMLAVEELIAGYTYSRSEINLFSFTVALRILTIEVMTELIPIYTIYKNLGNFLVNIRASRRSIVKVYLYAYIHKKNFTHSHTELIEKLIFYEKSTKNFQHAEVLLYSYFRDLNESYHQETVKNIPRALPFSWMHLHLQRSIYY